METCPRCGDVGYLKTRKVGSRYYYYFVHYLGEGKKRECYIGPRDGYVAVEKVYGMHHLGLEAIIDVDFAFVAENAIENYANRAINAAWKAEDAAQGLEALKAALQRLEEIRELLEEKIREIKEEMEALEMPDK